MHVHMCHTSIRQWQSDTTQDNHYWKPPVESCVAAVCVVDARTIFSLSALSLACIALCSISFVSFVRPSPAAAGTAGVSGRGQWVGSIGVVHTHNTNVDMYVCTQLPQVTSAAHPRGPVP